MFCQKCGNEIDADAVVCPKCGCPTNKFAETAKSVEEVDKTSAWLVVLSLLIPLAGVILGIIYLAKKRKSGSTYLICGIISWILWAVILI